MVLTTCVKDAFDINRISGVMVISMIALSRVDHGFKPWWGHTTDYKISTCCFSVKHAALRSNSTDWMELE